MYESEYTPEEWKMIGEELDLELEDEAARWRRNQVHEGMLSVSARLIQIKVNTIITLLRKLGVSEEELNTVFKQEALEQMKRDFDMIMKDKRKSDLAVAHSTLLGPNGTPL